MAVIFADNFTGTVNATLSTRTASGGGAWQCFGVAANDVAGLKINAANQVKVGTATGCLARAEMGVADHYAKAAILTLTTAAAVVVRATDNLNFIGYRIFNTTTVELFKRVAGTETSLFRVTVPSLTAPTTLQLTFVGTTATLFVNGAQVGLVAGYQVPDAGFGGVTKVGLWGKLSALDPIADDFEGGSALTGLLPARGRSGSTDRNVGVTSASASALVVAATGRSGLTDRGVAILWTAALGPASSRSAQRASIVAIGSIFGITVARAVHAERTGTVAIARLGQIAPAGARHVERAGSAAAQRFGAGVVTPVPAEVRTITVPHD